jgi:hypothetical protein
MADEHENSVGTTKRIIRAAIVSAVSGAITYGIRKAVPAIQAKLQSGNGSVPETLGKAKDAVGEKVGGATSAVSDRIGGGQSTPSRSTPKLSNAQLDQRLKQRAKRRAEREKTLTT